MIPLDTNVLSDARARRSPALMAWLQEQVIADLHLSAVTLLELERGVRRKNASIPQEPGRCDDGSMRTCGRPSPGGCCPSTTRSRSRRRPLHVPDPRPEMDALIAATALVHGLTLVTRNIKDFASVPVALFDPWTE